MNWYTHFDKTLVAFDPHGCMELAWGSRKLFQIPLKAEWAARPFGSKIAIFAEWELDDAIEEGLYE